jgi:hypothetical protein
MDDTSSTEVLPIALAVRAQSDPQARFTSPYLVRDLPILGFCLCGGASRQAPANTFSHGVKHEKGLGQRDASGVKRLPDLVDCCLFAREHTVATLEARRKERYSDCDSRG